MANKLTEEQLDKINTEFNETQSRQFSDSELSFLKKLNELYGNTLTARGINLIDPIEANLFHYNKMRMMGLTDLPRVSRTLVFFTRPECNFSYENINSIPFFKWLYSKRLGKMIMSMLTDPNYFLNAPSALNSSAIQPGEYEEIYKQLKAEAEAAELQLAQAADTDYFDYRQKRSKEDYAEESVKVDKDWAEKAGKEQASKGKANSELTAEEEEKKAQEALEADINLDELTDVKAIDFLSQKTQAINNIYKAEKAMYAINLMNRSKSFYSKLGGTHDWEIQDRRDKELGELGILRAGSWLNTYDKKRAERFNFTTPFIPLLSNTCVSVEGAKDASMEIHQYEEDKFSANLTVPKGFDEMWSTGQLTTSFEDIAYSPTALLFMVYLFYIHYVSRGHIMTTREHETERVLDYTMSIYIFVLGGDGRHIERWAKFTGCYPTSFPFSQQILHNVNIDKDVLQKFSISWNFNRYEPMDPQVFTDFNFLSESEWLFRLKPVFWEELYNRKANITSKMYDYEQLNLKDKEYLNMVLQRSGRNMSLWDVVSESNRGMSGKPPAALIDSDKDDNITNYWGGYPYIINGDEFIWATPQMNPLIGEIVRDVISVNDSGNVTGIKTNPVVTNMTDEALSGIGGGDDIKRAGSRNLQNVRDSNSSTRSFT